MKPFYLQNDDSTLYFCGDDRVFRDEQSGNAICLRGKDEFIVYFQPEGNAAALAIPSSAMAFDGTEYDNDTAVVLKYSCAQLRAKVRYATEARVYVKTIEVEAIVPGTVRRIALECRTVCAGERSGTGACCRAGADVRRGGEGQPVVILAGGASMFCGIEFPVAANNYHGAELCFTQAPYVALSPEGKAGSGMQTGSTFSSQRVIYGIVPGNGAEDAFAAYVRSKAIATRPARIYGDWALHDDFTPGDPVLTEELTLKNLENLKQFTEKSGVKFDCYLMDAFWFQRGKPYTEFRADHFPRGIRPVVDAVHRAGMEFGLWFDINCIHAALPGMEWFDAGLGNGALCLACDEVAELVYEGIATQVRDNDVRWIKLDFGYFECKNPRHNHSTHPAEYKEKAAANFLRIADALRALQPGLKILCYNGWTTTLEWMSPVTRHKLPGYMVSPFWAEHVDYVYCGDPKPSELPAPEFADSVTYYTDGMLRNFREALFPVANTDDHGSMVGSTATIYRLGRSTFRLSLLAGAMRGTNRLHFYGDVTLLNGDDLAYFKFVDNLLAELFAANCRYSVTDGDPRLGEPYGYLALSGANGYALLIDSSPAPHRFHLPLPFPAIFTPLVVNGEQVDLPGSDVLPEVSAFGYMLAKIEPVPADNTNLRVPFPPSETLHIDTSIAAALQLSFTNAEDIPLRSPAGLPEGVEVTGFKSDGRECSLNANCPDYIWSLVSWLHYDVFGCDHVEIQNAGPNSLYLKVSLQTAPGHNPPARKAADR